MFTDGDPTNLSANLSFPLVCLSLFGSYPSLLFLLKKVMPWSMQGWDLGELYPVNMKRGHFYNSVFGNVVLLKDYAFLNVKH